MRNFIAAINLFLAVLCFHFSDAQIVFDLMERKDLKLQEIDSIANKYFETKGTGRGTGYKQYQRWLYEMKFHVDETGYLRRENFYNTAYESN